VSEEALVEVEHYNHLHEEGTHPPPFDTDENLLRIDPKQDLCMNTEL
jgi:hypothetical protein